MAWLSADFQEREEQAQRRIRYLTTFAQRAKELRLPVETPGVPTAAADDALSGPNALFEAAELCFATNRTREGRDLAMRALEMLQPSPSVAGDRATSIRAVVLGGVLGQLKLLSISIDEVEFGISQLGRVVRINVGADLPPPTVDAVVAAIIACDPSMDAWKSFLNPWRAPERPGHLTGALVSPIRDLLPLFVQSPTVRTDRGESDRGPSAAGQADARAIWVALHSRYAARIRLLHFDRERLSDLRFRAPLIDWTLLTLHRVLLRRERPIDWVGGDATPARTAHDFLARLAQGL